MPLVVKLINKQCFKIQIKDSGVGIKKEDIGKLFKMFGFLQSKNDLNPKGIGLGLHIS